MNVITSISQATHKIFSPFHESFYFNQENLKIWQMALRDGTNLGLGIAKLIPGIASIACAVSVIKGIMVSCNSPVTDTISDGDFNQPYVDRYEHAPNIGGARIFPTTNMEPLLADENLWETITNVCGIFLPFVPPFLGIADIIHAVYGASITYEDRAHPSQV